MKIPESIQRRDFIKQLGLASTAALATNGSQAWGSEEIIHPAAKADSCILSGWRAAWRHQILLIPKDISL